MREIVIIPKKEEDTDFLLTLLKSLRNVSSVEIRTTDLERSTKADLRISEASIAKDWLSEEDDRWDELLK